MNDHIRIFSWEQDINLAVADEFCSKLEQLVLSEEKSLVLDLQEISYINSVALGAIANAVLHSRKLGKELVVAGVTGTLEEIFQIVKFASFVKLFARVEDAEAYFEASGNQPE